MTPDNRNTECLYSVKIETATGEMAYLPVLFLTANELEDFIQHDFNRLVQEAGARGARIHVERVVTAAYENFLRDLAACLRTAENHDQPVGERRACGAQHLRSSFTWRSST